mgnify:CR=1 FL=1
MARSTRTAIQANVPERDLRAAKPMNAFFIAPAVRPRFDATAQPCRVGVVRAGLRRVVLERQDELRRAVKARAAEAVASR